MPRFEGLGVALEPLLTNLSDKLGARPLAVWILRTDGRHFLEEAPSGERTSLPESSLGPPDHSRPSHDLHSWLGDIETLGSDSEPTRELALASTYPNAHPERIGLVRTLLESHPLYTLLDSSSDPIVKIELNQKEAPEGFQTMETWICKLHLGDRLIGFLGFPCKGNPDPTERFPEVWRNAVLDLQRVQIDTALMRRTEILKAAMAVGDSITSQLEIRDVLQAVVEQATVLMEAKISSLLLVDETNKQLVLESVYGSTPEYIEKPNLDLEKSLLGRVVRNGRPLRVRDVRTCKEYTHRDLAKSEGLVSLLAVPLKWHEASIGVLNVYSANPHRYTQDNVLLLSMLASQAAIAIQNARTVSRSQKMEEQIHELDKFSVVGELAAGIAHEIRNPLAAVRMLVDSWEAIDDNQREDISVISQQLQGINRCVTQLLETARPRSPEFEAVNLSEEIGSTLQALRVRIREQNIQIHVDVSEDLSPLWADPSRFRQLQMNLMINSLNALERGGDLYLEGRLESHKDFEELPGTVIVSPTEGIDDREKENVLFVFSDNGGGLPHADVLEAFEPFHSRTTGGFGLGLSVVKRIVEEHGAGLKLHNRAGEGLSYFVLFARSQTGQPETQLNGRD